MLHLSRNSKKRRHELVRELMHAPSVVTGGRHRHHRHRRGGSLATSVVSAARGALPPRH
jgi:hypothetical protein